MRRFIRPVPDPRQTRAVTHHEARYRVPPTLIDPSKYQTCPLCRAGEWLPSSVDSGPPVLVLRAIYRTTPPRRAILGQDQTFQTLIAAVALLRLGKSPLRQILVLGFGCCAKGSGRIVRRSFEEQKVTPAASFLAVVTGSRG